MAESGKCDEFDRSDFFLTESGKCDEFDRSEFFFGGWLIDNFLEGWV